jgi:hypothetical protein
MEGHPAEAPPTRHQYADMKQKKNFYPGPIFEGEPVPVAALPARSLLPPISSMAIQHLNAVISGPPPAVLIPSTSLTGTDWSRTVFHDGVTCKVEREGSVTRLMYKGNQVKFMESMRSGDPGTRQSKEEFYHVCTMGWCRPKGWKSQPVLVARNGDTCGSCYDFAIGKALEINVDGIKVGNKLGWLSVPVQPLFPLSASQVRLGPAAWMAPGSGSGGVATARIEEVLQAAPPSTRSEVSTSLRPSEELADQRDLWDPGDEVGDGMGVRNGDSAGQPQDGSGGVGGLNVKEEVISDDESAGKPEEEEVEAKEELEEEPTPLSGEHYESTVHVAGFGQGLVPEDAFVPAPVGEIRLGRRIVFCCHYARHNHCRFARSCKYLHGDISAVDQLGVATGNAYMICDYEHRHGRCRFREYFRHI